MRVVLIILILLIFISPSAQSQHKQLLYDFNEVPQALLLNPGMTTAYTWYVGIPILSGISVQAGSSGVSVNDLFANDGVDFNTKFREKVVYGMNFRDELSGSYQIDLIHIGFRSKKNEAIFYSLGAYTEGDAIGYFFKDYALLAFEGNTANINKKFDLSHLKTRGELLNVYHFGIQKKESNQISWGVRAKLYASFMNFTSTKNRGYFVTTEGQNNILRTTLDADVTIRTSGIFELKDVLDNDNLANGPAITKILSKRALLGGNLGLGFDVGFTYYLNERTSITGSLLDIGFIYHTKDVRSYSLKGNASTEGIEIILPEDPSSSGEDKWQHLIDELEPLVPYEERDTKYISFRPTKLNASVRYDFGEPIEARELCDCTSAVRGQRSGKIYSNSIGGHLYAINRPRGPQTAFSAFYQRRLGNWISFKTSYTLTKFSYTNLGLGGSMQVGPLNIYLMVDHVLAYKNIADSQYASLQFGLNILSWGQKK